jgi:VanZ family protein
MQSANVVNGEKDWETARVILVSHNQSGQPMYQRSHQLAALSGSHDWQHVEKVFAIDAEVASLEVAAQLVRSSGELGVRGFSLRPVLLKTAFLHYRGLLLWAWLALAIWLAIPLLRASLNSWRHAVLLALILGILLGVLSPHDIKTAFGDAIWPSENSVPAEFAVKQAMDTQFFSLSTELPKLDLFKVGHFLMFALLAMALRIGQAYRVSAIGILGYLLLLATVSEVLQLFIAGRSSQLKDIAVDMSGALFGLLLAWFGKRVYWRSWLMLS